MKKLFFLFLLVTSFFLISDSSNQLVKADPPNCTSCDESLHNCRVLAYFHKQQCDDAAAINGTYNGVTATYGYCATKLSDDLNACQTTYGTCLNTCTAGGSGSGGNGGGGSGPGRNECHEACRDNATECFVNGGDDCGAQFAACKADC